MNDNLIDKFVGDTLEDRSIIIEKKRTKKNVKVLLVAPRTTEVKSKWTPEFPKVFLTLKEQGFDPSQWFIPTCEQLILAYTVIPNQFDGYHWSCTESPIDLCKEKFTEHAFSVRINAANFKNCTHNLFLHETAHKDHSFYVRAFRCVTY